EPGWCPCPWTELPRDVRRVGACQGSSCSRRRSMISSSLLESTVDRLPIRRIPCPPGWFTGTAIVIRQPPQLMVGLAPLRAGGVGGPDHLGDVEMFFDHTEMLHQVGDP